MRRRDTDYSATLARIEIRRRRASGTATITITPKDQGTGTITLTGNVAGMNVIAGQIRITTASLGVTSLTATPASVRENAGQTEIALTATLDKAAVVDETVTLRIMSGSGSAVRDVDYRATLPPGSAITIRLAIPGGRRLSRSLHWIMKRRMAIGPWACRPPHQVVRRRRSSRSSTTKRLVSPLSCQLVLLR